MSDKYVFSEADYISGDGMMTSIWGPPMWHFLHIVSFNYPIKPTKIQKEHYYNFFNNLQNILPCKYCRDNLTKNYTALPLNMTVFKNRESLSKYVYNLHELINKMLGKVSNLSYNDVRDRYEHFRARCLEPPSKMKKITHDGKHEKGCTEPLYGKKSKCIIKIVPQDKKVKTFQVDKKCIKTRKIDR